LNATVVGSGSAGTAAVGVVTIQGITGMTPVVVTADKSTTGTLTSVASATSSTTLLVSNTARVSATFYNESTSKLYLALNATASLTAYSVQIMPNSYFELPIDYTGAISGIWMSANGFVRITELS